MLLREAGFTYNGEHSYGDHRMLYAEKDAGHMAWGAVRRNEYQIGGMSGTVLFPGEEQGVLTFTGTLYPHEEPASQAEAQQLIRRVQRWLLAGRKRLIFDYEPDYFYLAQLNKAAQWSIKNWFGGELGIAFEAQPYAYAVKEDVTSVSGEGELTARAAINTLYDAPAVIRVTNAGLNALTRVSVNGGQILFTGLSLENRQELVISSEPPIGATAAGQNALPCCQAFSPLFLHRGANEVAIEADSAVSVEIRARGRW